ncbi:MAG: hypothetical protein HQL60_03860, partial [Magnetococcales bacterium]|nr:hypothetical protein [Magnetococcales bacterium]
MKAPLPAVGSDIAMVTDANQQLVMQMLAIGYEQMDEKGLGDCLNRALLFKKTRYQMIRPAQLRSLLADLQRQKQLVFIDTGVVQNSAQTARYWKCPTTTRRAWIEKAKRDEWFESMAKSAAIILPYVDYYSKRQDVSYERLVRDTYLNIHAGDHNKIRNLEKEAIKYCDGYPNRYPIFITLMRAGEIDWNWMRQWSHEMQLTAIDQMVYHHLLHLEAMEPMIALLEQNRDNPVEQMGHYWRYYLYIVRLLRGETALARAVLEHPMAIAMKEYLSAWMVFLQGDNSQALQLFEQELKRWRKESGQRTLVFADLGAIWFTLAQLKAGVDTTQSDRLIGFIETTATRPTTLCPGFYQALRPLLMRLRYGDKGMNTDVPTVQSGSDSWSVFFQILVHSWIDATSAGKRIGELRQLHQIAFNHGHGWMAMQSAFLLARLDRTDTEMAQRAVHLNQQSGMTTLDTLFAPKESWEWSLATLLDIGRNQRAGGGQKSGGSRMAWFIQIGNDGSISLQPKEQLPGKTGGWSKGRAVALSRLFQSATEFDCASAQDIHVCQAIKKYKEGYYGGVSYVIDWQQALLALVGHPYVFSEEMPTVPIEIVRGEPALVAQEQRNQITIQFTDPIHPETQVRVIQESPTRLRVVAIDKIHQHIAQIIGPKGLTVPVTARDQALQAIVALSSRMTIHSTIAGGEQMEQAEVVPADATPWVYLMPAGSGLRVRMLVQPFSTGGPSFTPGQGGKTLFTEINGKKMQTTRSLRMERSRAEEVISQCPAIGMDETPPGQPFEWVVEDAEECLELLLTLQAQGERIRLYWPEGEKLKITRPVSFENLKLSIHGNRGWFEVEGQVNVDANMVLAMNQLLEQMGTMKGRFIPLGNGQFLTLTQELHKRLLDLRAFTERHGNSRRLHPLAAQAVDDLVTLAGEHQVDRQWQQHLKNIERAAALEPQLPSVLQAELRDYQLQGFFWLARLAAWGVGACLADDMGLGKTIQALTLVLTRAHSGPTLVVAPLSVLNNWVEEACRFAPTLNPLVFGGTKRQEQLEQLQPFDLVVCSYGLLQQEGERLATVTWQTIILDEAQAIKNSNTKRSQAAMELKGAFRMITTGTPIENRL